MNLSRIVLAALLAAGMVCAQGQRGFGPRGSADGSTATPPTPAQIAQRETNRLTKFFNLTATQESTVLTLLTSVNTQTQALNTQMQPLHTTLVAAIKTNNQSQISTTLQQLSALHEQEQVIRANAAGQIYTTVLTATQQAQVGTGLGPLMNGGPGPGRFGGHR